MTINVTSSIEVVPLRTSNTSVQPPKHGSLNVLLLENINESGVQLLTQQGYNVEAIKTSLTEAQLIEKIRNFHVVGIRSKTKLSAKVLREARNLLAVACFCIGTDQVDLDFATQIGIPVFNSPFSNSRSVAELVISEIIALSRQWADRSNEMHHGTWKKSSGGCYEIRGKTLGLIGYGHVGSQVSVLAEAMGMKVIFHDVRNLMAMGTARQVADLNELLHQSDFVTLHVPEQAHSIIGAKQFEAMKHGSYLLNASRGSVVDISALIDAMNSGKIAGAALDVYPNEPRANGLFFTDKLSPWIEKLRQLQNIILTPHIGGSTEEAQSAIGVEVAKALIAFITYAETESCVNLGDINMIKQRRSALITEGLSVRVDRCQLPSEDLRDSRALPNPLQAPTIIARWLELSEVHK